MAFNFDIDVVSLGTVVAAVLLYILDTRILSKSSESTAAIEKKFTDLVDGVSTKIDDLVTELRGHARDDLVQFEQIRREVGETIMAVRVHMQGRADEITGLIHKEQLRTRDEYIRKESFKEVIDTLYRDFDYRQKSTEAWLIRIEGKIDLAARVDASRSSV